MNPKVDEFIDKAQKWHIEMSVLRTILLDCNLTEELKWGQPCYSFNNSNVVMIGLFKDFCTLSFFKGTLLSDSNGILNSPGENSQAIRMIKFTNVKEIEDKVAILKAYIFEAIEIEKAGLKVEFTKSTVFDIPEEFQKKLDEMPNLKTAFESLTPGRQRAYVLYFSAGKQSQTRESRVEKYIPQILDGKGINDCTCGLSKKMPACDGTHRFND
ncbi:MAG: YdeI/OmpD-associated family protein [Bacteroidales bacterium]|nr:YdeI/OmpD-associated family protein [Bacteroidales bacterium]